MTNTHTESPQAMPAIKATPLKRWSILILLCLVVFAVLAGLKYWQVSKAIAFANSFPERSETVSAVIAEADSIALTYRTIGEVQATRYLELRAEVDGKISEINFRSGESVAQGQVLVKLDSSEERAQLQAARAQLKLAELQLQRIAGLHGKNLASKNDLDIARADKDVLLANIAALQATIDKKNLAAPFAAETGVHSLHVGQYLAANTLITELSGGDGAYWVDFDIPQDKATIKVGDTVSLSARHLDTGPLTATIVSADSRIDSRSRSRGFRVLLENAPASLRPGAVVDVELTYGTMDNVFPLPAAAVRQSNFGAFVYLLEPAEAGADARYRAVRTAVTTAQASDSTVLITSGIEAGDRVAATGAFKLEDGLLAHIAASSEVDAANGSSTQP